MTWEDGACRGRRSFQELSRALSGFGNSPGGCAGDMYQAERIRALRGRSHLSRAAQKPGSAGASSRDAKTAGSIPSRDIQESANECMNNISMSLSPPSSKINKIKKTHTRIPDFPLLSRGLSSLAPCPPLSRAHRFPKFAEVSREAPL